MQHWMFSDRKSMALWCFVGCFKYRELPLLVLLHPSINTEQSHLQEQGCSPSPTALLSPPMGPRRCPVLGLWDRHWLTRPGLTDPHKEPPLPHQPPRATSPHSGMRVSPLVFHSFRGSGCHWMPWQLSNPSATREGCPAGKMVNGTWFKLCTK